VIFCLYVVFSVFGVGGVFCVMFYFARWFFVWCLYCCLLLCRFAVWVFRFDIFRRFLVCGLVVVLIDMVVYWFLSACVVLFFCFVFCFLLVSGC